MERLDLSIGRRLALAFAATFLLMLAAIVVYLIRDQMQNSATQYLTDRVMLRADAASDLESAFLLESSGARSYVYSGNEQWLGDYHKGLDMARDAMSRLDQLPETPEGTELFNQIKPLAGSVAESTDAAIALRQQGKTAEAQQLLDHVTYPSRNTLLDLTTSFKDLQMTLRDQTKAEATQIRAHTVRDSIALASVAFLLALLLAYSTTRAIKEPVQILVSASDRLAGGDYESAIEMADSIAGGNAEDARSEIRRLASRFRLASGELLLREKSLSAHASLASALASTLDVEQLAERALAETASYTEAGNGCIYSFDANGDGLSMLASYPPGVALPETLARAEGIAGEAAESQRAVFVHGMPEDRPSALVPGSGQSAPRWLAAIPMVCQAKTVGVLLLAGLAYPSKAQMAFMEQGANQLAVSLEYALAHRTIEAQNAELRAQSEEILAQNEELQTQNEELEMQSVELSEQNERLAEQNERVARLQEVAQRLSDTLFPGTVLDGVVSAARDLTGSAIASVLLLDESGDYFTVAAADGLDERTRAALRLPRNESVAGQAIAEGRAIFLEDTSMSENVRFPQLAGGESVGSIIVAPLIARGEPLGVVEVYYPQPRTVSASDVEMMSALGSAAAAAVHNSRLYDMVVRQKVLTEGILAGIPEAVLVVDTQGWITLTNASANEMFGVSEGQRLSSQLLPGGAQSRGRAELWEVAGQALSGESVKEQEVRYSGGGQEGYALAAGAPVRQDGVVVRAVIVAADISHLKAVEKARDEFFSVASHELKSPLTSVKGYAQLLQRFIGKGADPAEVAKMAQTIVDHTNRVVDQVNRLLDLSRAQLGSLEIQPEQVNLAELIKRQTEAVQVKTGKHKLIADLTGDLSGHWDRTGMTQVITNLLENAVRYSPDGGEIRIAAARRGNEVMVTVTDQGIGIPPEMQARVFERHFRTDDARKVRADGMGIGLYLVREVVAAHGGTVSVESEVGRGSTFSITLPLSS